MKKRILSLAVTAFLIVSTSIQCGSSSALSAGSSLMSALGGAPNLSTFSSILQTPGLSNLLGSSLKGPFTMLAPTNNALSSLGPGVLENLAKPENLNQLAGILNKHIIPGKLGAADLLGSGIKTAAGSNLNLGGAKTGEVISDKKFNIFPIDKVLQ